MVKRVPREDQIERQVLPGQWRNRRHAPGDVLESPRRRERPRLLDHRSGRVDALDLPGRRGDRARHETWSAGDVEHAVLGPNPARRQQQLERALVAHGRSGGVSRSLRAELPEDRGAVLI